MLEKLSMNVSFKFFFNLGKSKIYVIPFPCWLVAKERDKVKDFKICSFFWKNIIIILTLESYIESVSHFLGTKFESVIKISYSKYLSLICIAWIGVKINVFEILVSWACIISYIWWCWIFYNIIYLSNVYFNMVVPW
jgi:hypothetical protein